MTSPDAKPHPRVLRTIGSLGAAGLIDAMAGRDVARDPLIDRLAAARDAGFDAVEDYVAFALFEPEAGRFDDELVALHREAADRAGLKYVVYPWLHALPRWLRASRRFDPFQCLEHDAPIEAPSPFAPSTWEWFERFYAQLARAAGDVDGVTIAVPCDYGEVAFPTGVANWIFAATQGPHAPHEGHWCGDPFAREAWRRSEFAAMDVPTARGRFLRHAMTGFVDRLLSLARSHFPRARLAFKCGLAGEKACFGNDLTALGRVAARHGADLWSTHGTLPVYFHKRIQTICRTLGVPYMTEGVVERSQAMVVERLFEDAADGARGFFEFEATWSQYRPVFDLGLSFVRGEDPFVDVALLFHSSQHEREPGQSAPPTLYALSEPLRDFLDYAIVDEDLLHEPSALSAIRMLCIADGGRLRRSSVDRIREFVRAGGIVVTPARDVFDALVDTPLPAWPSAREFVRFAGPGGFDARELHVGDGDAWHRFGRWHGLERAAAFFADAAQDEPARWTSGHAGLRVSRAQSVTIELFADARVDPASWRIHVDGVERPQRLTAGAQRITLTLPALDGICDVELRGPTFTPSRHGDSPDARDLGVLVRHVRTSSEDDRAPTFTPLPHLRADVDIGVLETRACVRDGLGAVLAAPEHDVAALAAVLVDVRAVAKRFTRGAALEPWPRGAHDGLRVARNASGWLLHNRGSAAASRYVLRHDETVTKVVVAPGSIVSIR
ncbi:MAG: hypothetical protein JNL94_05190 [Planctomycetes bacterium]|nr:hypothetical protein [Planctomycetota bacterium]